MTKKKRNHPDVEELLARPWCYYCERDFDDLKILINHQKAKHFKCERCGRRLNTAGGLSVHMSQVHKENLTAVDNALPNRAGLDIEIFAMEGIPEDIFQQHNQRVLTQYHQAEAERRAVTGNSGAAGQGGNQAKKPKTEDISDLKRRLAEHKAAKLAAEQNGGSSGSATPTGAGQTVIQAPGQQPAPIPYQSGSPSALQYQQPYAPPPPPTTTFGRPQTYSPAAVQSGYQAPGYNPSHTPTYGQPPIQVPYQQPPYSQSSQPPFQQPAAYAPPFPAPSYTSPAPFPGQQHTPHMPQNSTNMYSAQSVGPPRPFGASLPGAQLPQQQQQQHQRTQSPAQGSLPVRTNSGGLPSASGLPQRPAVGAPPVNAFQFQQMHQGQIPASQTHHVPQQLNSPPGVLNGVSSHSPPGQTPDAPNAAAIDDLISSASKQADATITAVTQSNTPQPLPSTPAAGGVASSAKEEVSEEKSSKKEKEKEKTKQTRLVYSDNEVSPEERMAMLPRYAYVPQQQTTAV